MTKLKELRRSRGSFRSMFLPSQDKIAPDAGPLDAPSSLMAFDDIITIQPETTDLPSLHEQQQSQQQQQQQQQHDEQHEDEYYYPDFLPNLLQLEVPVRNHLLKYLDPSSLASVEFVSKACLRAVRSRGYWKNVVTDVLKQTDAIERRIVERYDDAVRRLLGKDVYLSCSPGETEAAFSTTTTTTHHG